MEGGGEYVGVAMSVISDREWEHLGGAVSDPTLGDRKNVCRFLMCRRFGGGFGMCSWLPVEFGVLLAWVWVAIS